MAGAHSSRGSVGRALAWSAPQAARVLKARCDEALDALAAAEVAKSGDVEPEVWARVFWRECESSSTSSGSPRG